jgi:hypothetical protein
VPVADPVIITTTGVRLLNVDDPRSTRRLLADNFVACFQRGETVAHYAQRYRVARELLENVLRWYLARPDLLAALKPRARTRRAA